MMTQKMFDSILVLDKLLNRAYRQIDLLEAIENEKLITEGKPEILGRIDSMLEQIYRDRTAGNYKSAVRKCLFLKGYIQRELRGRE